MAIKVTIISHTGGPTTGTSGAPAPPPVTVTGFSVGFREWSGLMVPAFNYTINFPTTHPDYTLHFQSVYVRFIDPITGAKTLINSYPKPSSGTTTVVVGDWSPKLQQLITDQTGCYLEFISYNELDEPSTPTLVGPFTIPKAQILTFSGTDNTGVRYIGDGHGVGKELHAVVDLSYTATNAMWVTVQSNSPQYGLHWQKWYYIGTSGTITIGAMDNPEQTSIFPPDSDETVVFTIAPGKINGDVDLTTVAGFLSTNVTVHAANTPSSTGISGAYIDALRYPELGDGSHLFGWDGLHMFIPADHSTWWFTRSHIETGHYVGGVWTPGGVFGLPDSDGLPGTSLGDWEDDDSHDAWIERGTLPNEIVIHDNGGWPMPDPTNNIVRVYTWLATRKGGPEGTKVQQQCYSSGVGVSTPGTNLYQEFTLDVTKGKFNLTRVVPESAGAGLQFSIDGLTLQTAPTTNVLLNPSFEKFTGPINTPGATFAQWYVLDDGVNYDKNNIIASDGSESTGGHSLCFVSAAGKDGAVLQYGNANPLPAHDGELWFLSFRTYRATADGVLNYAVIYHKADGSGNGSDVLVDNINDHGWTTYQKTISIPGGTSYLEIAVYTTGQHNGSGQSYVDWIELRRQVSVGAAMEPDGKGGVQLRLGGPLYADVANNLAIQLSPHFVVGTDNKLTQAIVDLALATNFDISEFKKVGSSFLINTIAVNKLIAGDALFAGQATFAYNGGGKVTINSLGITLADNNTTPTATVTITSTGISVVKGTSSVAVTASSVAITNGNLSLTAGTSNINIDPTNVIKVDDPTWKQKAYINFSGFYFQSTAAGEAGIAALAMADPTGGFARHGTLFLQDVTGAARLNLFASTGFPINPGLIQGYIKIRHSSFTGTVQYLAVYI